MASVPSIWSIDMVATETRTTIGVDHAGVHGLLPLAHAASLARRALVGLMVLALAAAQAAEPATEYASRQAKATAGPARAAAAAPLTVQGFDAQRWAALLSEPGPALVVFTATDCAHCPQAIERLKRHQRDERRAGRPVPRLDVVVLDGRDEPDALATEAHYQSADRLFAVDGQPARVRHNVNPAWFGQTPYVALVGSSSAGGQAPVRFVSGTPTDRDLKELR
jgi:hypothetical protein